MNYAAVIFGALIMGALIGLIPGITGYKKDKRGLAVSGFISCVVGSFILGLYLSIPICIIFTVIIVLSGKKTAQLPSGPGTAANTPRPGQGAGRCVQCGGPLAPGQTFCTSCGTRRTEQPVSNRCPSCGSVVPPGMVFCPKCGTKVG